MTEQQIQNNDQGMEQSAASNVIPFAHVANRAAGRTEPPPTDEELAEYRRLLPVLRAMVEQWPHLLRQHQAITSNCVLAKQILSGDP